MAMLPLSIPLLNKLSHILFCKPSQVPSHLLHLRWNRGCSTDGTDSNKGLTNGDCSNGILSFLSFLPLSPVSSFHLYIKVGLWISTEPAAFFTRKLSWMKRERKTIMSWIRWFTPIRFSRHIGVWNIEHLYKKKINDVIDLYLITRVRDKDCVKNRVKRANIVRFTLC